jgi:hypothetical protein
LKGILKVCLAVVSSTLLMLAAHPVEAMSLSPSTPLCPDDAPNASPCLLAFNNDNGGTDVEWLADLGIEATLEYKKDVGGGGEEGPAAAWYSTAFDPHVDPDSATITWNGPGAIDCPICYVIVKDGNSEPARYVFDLDDWDGLETILLTEFWMGQGAISHVAILRADQIQLIAEPATLLLLGSSLALARARLRRRRAHERLPVS